ncbi:peptidoglycan DD-metalloendopeptidase family protein [Vibrio sp. YMD68]|uniref:peptidoglycan DD-metalloendopeptidase family protein n=1 Tax=Vibrio sp. YMD68 TaxID=3042300 RepID=UPI00249CA0B5|nr:peptidoglycan DD-metalloendopeptidase family protein [Vibrio sp. YMD68]WGV99922.1 peptidoglycan DD-metalloendopeptidase family protein [Vibrio sp. YMD68]
MKSLVRNLVVIACVSVLIGCSARNPAPVSGLNKDYNSVSRGSYRGSFYEVSKGDTLYFISYITDKDVNEIIRYNNLKEPYTIHPGQKLNLWRSNYVAPAYGGTGAGAATVASVDKLSKNSNQTNTSAKTKVVQKDPPKKVEQSKSKEYVKSTGQQTVNKVANTTKTKSEKVNSWIWPTKGRIIKKFSAGEQGNKGIDIAGQRGQAIVSTAGGTVVYSGNALRGYGNLVIVKHNDNYLSAYAHNDRLLVQEGQSVKAGQKIATMGSSGTSSVRLHFEIRYQGKSVNPNRYLP